MKLLFTILFTAFSLTSVSALAYRPHHPHHPHPTRLTTYELNFSYTGFGCFLRAPANFIPTFAWPILNSGGVPVYTTQGIRILTFFDPLFLAPHLQRYVRNDMIVAAPQGLLIYPRYAPIPYGFVEVFETPLDAGLCH